ncbi:hypothetical protein PanWU01x14_250230, partial [Parasponia andersonii]
KKFVFDNGKEEIIQGIDREVSDRFRQWRYKLCNVFKDEGGEKDNDAPKTKVRKGVKRTEEWEKLCDYWGSEKQKLSSLIDYFLDIHHRFPIGWTKEVAHAKHISLF